MTHFYSLVIGKLNGLSEQPSLKRIFFENEKEMYNFRTQFEKKYPPENMGRTHPYSIVGSPMKHALTTADDIGLLGAKMLLEEKGWNA